MAVVADVAAMKEDGRKEWEREEEAICCGEKAMQPLLHANANIDRTTTTAAETEDFMVDRQHTTTPNYSSRRGWNGADDRDCIVGGRRRKKMSHLLRVRIDRDATRDR